MFKSNLIFVILVMVAKWQLLAVEADVEGEKAIAELQRSDKFLFELAIRTATVEDLFAMCYKYIIAYKEMEPLLVKVDAYIVNVSSEYVENVHTEVMVLECRTTEGIEYRFTEGKKRASVIAIEQKRTDHRSKYIPEMVPNNDFQMWKYIHDLKGPPAKRMAVCEKIFAKHHPGQQYRVVTALRAVRHLLDENCTSRKSMTLLCYYSWNNSYFEYCEGGNDNEVFQVTYHSSGEYMLVRTLPIHVDYQI